MKLTRNLFDQFMMVLIAAAVSIVFYYVGNFAVPASMLLGICFTIVAVWLYALWTLVAFKPYTVSIYVNFGALRDYLGLSRTDKPPDADEPMYDVYVFTAISAAVFALYQRYTGISAKDLNLTDPFVRSDEEYCSVIAFRDEIPCAFKPAQFDNPENQNLFPVSFFRPVFFFRPGQGGYQFGIHVIPEWWAEHRKQLSAQLRDLRQDAQHIYNNSEASRQLSTQMRDRPVNYSGEIVLASLPYGYIPDHIRSWWDKPISLRFPFSMSQRQRKANLAKHGWTIDDNDSGQLCHRYLGITYWDI